MTIQEISDLLDSKLDSKLQPVLTRLDSIEFRIGKIETRIDKIETRLTSLESHVSILTEEVRKVLKFVPVGNEDIADKLHKPKLKKA